MNRKTRVILLEFNELTPILMDRFIAEGRLPNFERFRRESDVFTTEAAESPPFLEPWIQWVTVHTGLDYSDHQVVRLNEGHKPQTKRVRDVLSAAGIASWICGSMNVGYAPGFNGCLVPDPWCTEVEPVPKALRPYFRFVQKNVLEHSNDRVPLSLSEYLAFIRFLMAHGISRRTLSSIVRQGLSERHGHSRWKRAVILDKLQFDIFRRYFRSTKPGFSTFFLNSTAHYQHSYWRNMDPRAFAVQPSLDEQAEYATAIRFGYEEMDHLTGSFLKLAGDDTTLVFCTALSQQACVKHEATGGAHFYRPRDFHSLARFAGISTRFDVAPIMAHQFHVDFHDAAAAADAERKLRALQVSSRPALQVERTGARIFAGCQIFTALGRDLRLGIADTDRSLPFFDVFYILDTTKTGMHHPHGMLWIRTPERHHSVREQKVPLAAVAPTILNMFGVPCPADMRSQPIRWASSTPAVMAKARRPEVPATQIKRSAKRLQFSL